jgi:hypothetical protein
VIDAALIEALADAVERAGLDEAAIAALRGANPGLHFTLCSDEDVPARLSPAATRAGFRVYLVDAGAHCVKFTADPDQASGLVFASID